MSHIHSYNKETIPFCTCFSFFLIHLSNKINEIMVVSVIYRSVIYPLESPWKALGSIPWKALGSSRVRNGKVWSGREL
jgi:hypothetical protein